MRLPSVAFISSLSLLAISCSTTPEPTGFRRKLTVYSEKTYESRFEWHGKLNLKKDGDGRYTIEADEIWADVSRGQRYWGKIPIYWPRDVPLPKRFDPAADYQVSFLEYAASPPSRNYPSLDVLEVSKDGKTLYDASVCKVHGKAMTRAYTEETSDQDYPLSFHRLKQRSFPNDGFDFPAMHSSPAVFPEWLCPSCHAASLRWKKSHGLDRPNRR